MRIVVAHDVLGGGGGVETYLAAAVPALQARGHQIAVLHHQGPREDLPVRADMCVSVEQQGFTSAFNALRQWHPDVWFSHNMAPLDVERGALAEWPVVKMMHGYFGTCVSALKSHGFPSVRACDRVLGPACLALYVPRHCGPLHPLKMMRGYRWATQQRELLDRYAAVIVASAHMGREYRRHGVDRDRLNVLPLFSDLTVESPQPAGEAVMFAGRMTTLKGGHVLIEAMAEVTRRLGRVVPLIMAGAGPQKEEWRRLAQRIGVTAEFTGWVGRPDRPALYRRASVLAVPSLWPEPFGLVGLEAAAFGIPAVAFDVGGVREWLRHDVTGRLVRASDGAKGLADEISTLLVDAARRQRLGAAARESAQMMSLDAHVNGVEQVLQAAASNPR
jgi:glycosyltransferase involved in cell wall biosynthesis